MPVTSRELQQIIDNFSRKRGVTPDAVANLQAAINGSPMLIEQLNVAVEKNHLKAFEPLTGSHAGGTYYGQKSTMSLPLAGLDVNENDFKINDMTFVLGHEVQHGFNHANRVKAYQSFDDEAKKIAKSSDPVNDYTVPMTKLIQAGREDEADAAIAGWNALLSRLKQTNPNASLLEMYGANYRAADFVELDKVSNVIRAKPGLTFNADGTLPSSPENIAAMGQYYFDKPSKLTKIGAIGTSDYANHYGAEAVNRAIHFERAFAKPQHGIAPQMTLDMARLRLDERQLEENGIELRKHPGVPQPYYDSSQSPPVLRHFDHTKTTHSHAPIAPFEPDELATEPQQIHFVPRHADHPDHALHRQILDKTREEYMRHGRAPQNDDELECIAASLTVESRRAGITQADHVLLSRNPATGELGRNIFVVQGSLDIYSPIHYRIDMPTRQAAEVPVEESFRQLEAVSRQQAQDRARELVPGQEQSQSRGGMRHTL